MKGEREKLGSRVEGLKGGCRGRGGEMGEGMGGGKG